MTNGESTSQPELKLDLWLPRYITTREFNDRNSETYYLEHSISNTPDSRVHVAHMGPIWGRQDAGGPHVGPMNFAIWDLLLLYV